MLRAVLVLACLQLALALGAVADPSPLNLTCMNHYCFKESAACLADLNCYKELTCSAVCMANWNKDPTPDKIHAQNCTTKCAISYQDNKINGYMACMMTHNCIAFPPIDVTCPVKELEAGVKSTASLASLRGEWWQHFGHNKLWDCYPCQHIHRMAPNGTANWAYTYSYDLFLENGGLKYFQQTWQLPSNPAGKPAPITYEYMGTLHNETWYILDNTDRYVILVDCSYMFSWTNLGSIVWVRPDITLAPAELASIAKVYKRVLGWTFPDDFCTTRHGATCDGPGVNAEAPRPGHQPRFRKLTIH